MGPPYNEWIPPKPALDMLAGAGKSNGIDAIFLRLKSGSVRAIAASKTTDDDIETMFEIPRDFWTDAIGLEQDGLFWTLGDVTFLRGVFSEENICHGVRFEPSGLQTLVDQLFSPPARVSAGNERSGILRAVSGESSRDAVERRGETRLSEAHLKAWWVFYQSTRDATRDTEDDALAHLARCFPENSVARARIRTLRGSRKPGPRPRAAE